jgi:hypothetical protein
MTRTWDNCASCQRLRSSLVNGLCAECRVGGAAKVLAEVVGELEAPRRRWWQRKARA